MTENEIINRILNGEKDLFRFLVEEHQAMVFRTCMGFVHNKDDADDLSQEVFVGAYQALHKFKGNSSFSTWLYRIAVNASLNKVRKSRKSFVFQQLESLFGPSKQHPIEIVSLETDDPEKIIIREENQKWLQGALDKLPEKQRTAIVLSKYDDLSQKEIAEIMNITEGAVEALIQRAKANLRKIISESSKKKF